MKIALHGYGKMGKAVERVAIEAGHEIVAAADAEVLIDFSHAEVLDRALDVASEHKLDLVIGTTGWNDRIDDVRARVESAGIGCVYASNFSPGANVTFALARRAGELFARFPQYDAGMQERHHAQKKDAPSGTALKIAAEVREGSNGKFDPPIAASRVGAEFGFHTLFFDSPDDVVEISHRARGREGFARGAVLAAELVRGRKGLLRFDQLLE
ncbi:MAG TPA: dihydrodipicolinate reductase C-terminal domain-containing protein [Thermoanaerobaculia bacterium]|jgi:4-hydroxy-tetrahydrodipicolinate reductase|nr:dihydrodipicolinate reductase C-terminal domain-containing protein [Thermoanaerobaculia bacterium]